MHEIGTNTPYKLYFAGKAKSGASFGFMQGDLAAGQGNVTETFVTILKLAGVAKSDIKGFLKLLAVHRVVNPLAPADTALINGAMVAGASKVDEMDQQILAGVFNDLDTCIAVAKGAGRQITGVALLFMALWINMSGHPTKLLDWLKGRDPHLVHPVPIPPAIVGAPDIRGYLSATDYYVSNPGNLLHLDSSVAVGASLVPAGVNAS